MLINNINNIFGIILSRLIENNRDRIARIFIKRQTMEYTFEKLNKDNFSKYYDYLSLATRLEPELMCTSDINKEELLERLDDELTKRSTSILAIDEDKVVGRIEYHFYSCFQDGYRYAMLTGYMYFLKIEIKG